MESVMNRRTTNRINYILDNYVPPIIRDSEWFYCKIVLRLAVGKKYKYYQEFKERVPYMSEMEINEYYRILADTFINRKTDLNQKCIEHILKEIVDNDMVLDAAAGRGYLAELISRKHNVSVTALDIVLPKERNCKIKYVEGSVSKLPFEDDSFDVVVCTHALEHIKDIDEAVRELRRVARKSCLLSCLVKGNIDIRLTYTLISFDMSITFENT